MIPKILAKIFSLLYRSEWIRDKLRADLYGSLFRADGTPYMLRYAVIRVGTKASKALAWVTRGRYDHVRLHIIMQPDADRELHNHPFNYRTFVLKGMYIEQLETMVPGFRMLGPGETIATKDSHFHRIAYIPSREVHTLFCMGPDTGEWGFLVDGKFMESHEFFKLRRIAADGKADGS